MPSLRERIDQLPSSSRLGVATVAALAQLSFPTLTTAEIVGRNQVGGSSGQSEPVAISQVASPLEQSPIEFLSPQEGRVWGPHDAQVVFLIRGNSEFRAADIQVRILTRVGPTQKILGPTDCQVEHNIAANTSRYSCDIGNFEDPAPKMIQVNAFNPVTGKWAVPALLTSAGSYKMTVPGVISRSKIVQFSGTSEDVKAVIDHFDKSLALTVGGMPMVITEAAPVELPSQIAIEFSVDVSGSIAGAIQHSAQIVKGFLEEVLAKTHGAVELMVKIRAFAHNSGDVAIKGRDGKAHTGFVTVSSQEDIDNVVTALSNNPGLIPGSNVADAVCKLGESLLRVKDQETSFNRIAVSGLIISDMGGYTGQAEASNTGCSISGLIERLRTAEAPIHVIQVAGEDPPQGQAAGIAEATGGFHVDSLERQAEELVSQNLIGWAFGKYRLTFVPAIPAKATEEEIATIAANFEVLAKRGSLQLKIVNADGAESDRVQAIYSDHINPPENDLAEALKTLRAKQGGFRAKADAAQQAVELRTLLPEKDKLQQPAALGQLILDSLRDATESGFASYVSSIERLAKDKSDSPEKSAKVKGLLVRIPKFEADFKVFKDEGRLAEEAIYLYQLLANDKESQRAFKQLLEQSLGAVSRLYLVAMLGGDEDSAQKTKMIEFVTKLNTQGFQPFWSNTAYPEVLENFSYYEDRLRGDSISALEKFLLADEENTTTRSILADPRYRSADPKGKLLVLNRYINSNASIMAHGVQEHPNEYQAWLNAKGALDEILALRQAATSNAPENGRRASVSNQGGKGGRRTTDRAPIIRFSSNSLNWAQSRHFRRRH